ncbi:class A beta-lactamase-related serine hydrolase [Lactobacillus rodentium]|uniref:Beta-lactamase class A n=1 Tax=Lactobacillus rodentium TaxID=947835 RepID=A0A2Z6TUF6_9LACO|nr:serine hydrolase [Lactobacillus rodentium]MCR1895036.1 class A beta-lactamase-related serine hydrolase [Lactobacillus rodentium]GBG05349.1 beta-lactamase class A [Lactobacillus rodentium]
MLKDELEALIPEKDVDTGIMLCYGDDILFKHNADKAFSAAGFIDLGIAAYLEDQWKQNPAILDETLEVTELSRVRGTGIISKLSQSKWSIRDLLYLMMAIGDNAASNLLIERFDIYEIDEWLKKNQPGMRLGREFMRYSPTGQDNEVTAESVMKLLDHFMTSKNPFSEIVRSGLENHSTLFNLLALENTELPTFNKMSQFSHLIHEASALRTQKGPLSVVVLTEFKKNKSDDIKFLQNFGKTLYAKVSMPQLPKTGLTKHK